MNSTIKACQEAAQLLVEMRQKKFPPPGPGWFTVEQFAEHSGRCRDTARRDLLELVRAGKFVSQKHPGLDSRGHLIQQTIYRKKQ